MSADDSCRGPTGTVRIMPYSRVSEFADVAIGKDAVDQNAGEISGRAVRVSSIMLEVDLRSISVQVL